MNNKIFPCLWFDGKAKEAAEFYCNIFENSKITADTPMVVNFEILGKKIMGLNGGPMFTITPAISLFINCKDDIEIVHYWNKLIVGGIAIMPINKYPWAEKYGWVKDKFGITWQLMIGAIDSHPQKINCSLLFVNDQFGNAKKAIDFYTKIFPNSTIHHQELYTANEPAPEGYLKFGHFTINGETFSAMDGSGNHDFTFSEGLSITVNCENQEEIDFYWEKLIENGGKESRCGWLKDKFGVSWQIVPSMLGMLLSNPEKSERILHVLMKSKKFIIEELENA